MPLFPMFIDLKDQDVLILGTGKHALDKAEKLRPFGPKIRTIPIGEFALEMLSPAPALVVLAQTGHPDNAPIAALCLERNIPVNAVDDPTLCTVRFPALVTRGELSIGIATNGLSPVVSSLLREEIEEALPEDMEAILLWAGALTARLRQEIPDYGRRTALLRTALIRALELGRPLTEEEL